MGRTPIGAFIHSTWTNMNVRTGKYKHLRTEEKCKTYNYDIAFTQSEWRDFCTSHASIILSLKRPSVDRIDNSKGCTLDNIQFIELGENIGKDRGVATEDHCTCYACKEVKPLEEFVISRRAWNGRATICVPCDRVRSQEKYRRRKARER